MPVPNSMADLFSIASSNSPAGTEAIGNSLDNYIRAGFAILKSTNSLASSTVASASTTDIGSADGESVSITGTATINSFGAGFVGCVREVRFVSTCTIVSSANIFIPGSVNITTVPNGAYIFRCVGSGVWVLVGGSYAINRAGDTFTGNVGLENNSASGLPRLEYRSTDTAATYMGQTWLGASGSFRGGVLLRKDDNSVAIFTGTNGITPRVNFTGSGSNAAVANGAVRSEGTSAGFEFIAQGGSTRWLHYAFGATAAWFNSVAANNVMSLTEAGTLTVAGTLIATSDERVKGDWEELPGNLVDSFAKLKAGEYTRTDIGGRQVGVGAQSLAKFLPLAVHEDESGTLGVAYGNAALLGVVALARRILALEAKVGS